MFQKLLNSHSKPHNSKSSFLNSFSHSSLHLFTLIHEIIFILLIFFSASQAEIFISLLYGGRWNYIFVFCGEDNQSNEGFLFLFFPFFLVSGDKWASAFCLHFFFVVFTNRFSLIWIIWILSFFFLRYTHFGKGAIGPEWKFVSSGFLH